MSVKEKYIDHLDSVIERKLEDLEDTVISGFTSFLDFYAEARLITCLRYMRESALDDEES